MPIDKEFRDSLAKDIAADMASREGLPEADTDDVAPVIESDATEVETDDSSETDAGGSTEAEVRSKPLRDRYTKLGYKVDDDTDEDDLAEATLARLAQLEEDNRRLNEAIKAEQAARTEKPKPEIAEPKKESKQERARKLSPIPKPDQELSALVEFDEDTKRFVGKDKFGSAGAEAAKLFNDYQAQRNSRAELWFDDPVSAVIEDAGDEIDRRVEEKLQAYFKSIEQKQAEKSVVEEREKSEKELVGFLESIKEELYELTPTKQIKRTISNQPVFTEAGKLWLQEYESIQALNPTAPQSLIAKKAYETLNRFSSLMKPAPPKETVVEKKKKFVEKRKHESGVPANVPGATFQDKVNSGNKLRLWQALLEDDANQDNPDLATYRK